MSENGTDKHQPSIRDSENDDKNPRRKALKGLAAGGGIFALSEWTRPVVETVILPVHAQTSPQPDPDPDPDPEPEPECDTHNRNVTVEIRVDAGTLELELRDGNSAVIGTTTLNVVTPNVEATFSGIMREIGGCNDNGEWNYSGTINGGFPDMDPFGSAEVTISGCISDCFSDETGSQSGPGGGFTCCREGTGTIDKVSGGGSFPGLYSGTIALDETCGENGADCLPDL